MMDMAQNQGDIAAIVEDQFARLLGGTVSRGRLEAADGGEFDQELWQQIAQAGMTLALLEEDRGGIGLPALQAFRLVRLAAQYALPLPLGETMVVAALIGAPSEAPMSLTAERASGALALVPYGAVAQQVLAATAGGWTLTGGPGACESGARNLAGEPRDRLRGEGADPVDMPAWLDAAADGDPVIALRACGAMVRSAGMAGLLRRVLEMSVEHAKERQQFGRPLAKFQALQHMLAVAAEESAAASAIVDAAAESWGRDDFVLRVAMAKSRAGLAAGRVAAIGHQIHAAMGFTQEHDLHFFTRRLMSWRDEFGPDAEWDAWLGQKICAAGGAALWPTVVAATTVPQQDGVAA